MTNAIYNPLLSQYFPPQKKHKGRDRGANSRGGAYFKFWLSLRRGAYSKAVLIQGGGGGHLLENLWCLGPGIPILYISGGIIECKCQLCSANEALNKANTWACHVCLFLLLFVVDKGAMPATISTMNTCAGV